jgi:hypothetical protein
MSNYWSKQPSSRPIKYQVLAHAGGGSSVLSANFASETFQIFCSEVLSWFVIFDKLHGTIQFYEMAEERRVERLLDKAELEDRLFITEEFVLQ